MRGTHICATVTANGIASAMQGCALMVLLCTRTGYPTVNGGYRLSGDGQWQGCAYPVSMAGIGYAGYPVQCQWRPMHTMGGTRGVNGGYRLSGTPVNGIASPMHTTWRVPMSMAYLAGTRVNGTPVNSGVPISGTPVNGIASAMHSGLRTLVLLCIRVHGTGTRRSSTQHGRPDPPEITRTAPLFFSPGKKGKKVT